MTAAAATAVAVLASAAAAAVVAAAVVAVVAVVAAGYRGAQMMEQPEDPLPIGRLECALSSCTFPPWLGKSKFRSQDL